MASTTLNGSFQGSNAGNYAIKCECTSTSNGSTANTSNVTVKLYMRRTVSLQYPQWNLYTDATNGAISNITIDGTSKGSTVTTFDTRNTTGWILLTSFTKNNISHNSNGSKSISISASFEPKATSSLYGGAVSGTFTLDTIARAATITSVANVTLGNQCSVVFTPTSTDFQYDLYFKLGTWQVSAGKFSVSTTSQYTYNYYKIPSHGDPYGDELLKQIPNKTGTMTVTLYTYDKNGTQIGSIHSKNFTVTVPSSIAPSIGTISKTINTYSKLIQNKNTVSIRVSGCSAGIGSSIKSYTFAGTGISSGTITTSSQSASKTTSSIGSSGTKKYTVTITDNRGHTASKSIEVYCWPYASPTLPSFSAYRSNSSGGADATNGTYINCKSNVKFSSVDNTNNVSITIYYKITTDTKYSSITALINGTNTSFSKLISNISKDLSYNVYAEVVDAYGGTSQSATITIYNSLRILNISQDGTGFAIGKMAESNNLLDVRWPIRTDEPAKTMNNLTMTYNAITSTSNDTTANWVAKGNLATSYYNAKGQINGQPSQYGFLLNFTNDASLVHNIWAASGGSLYHRSGTSNGFDTWKEIIDQSNYTNYVLQKPTSLYNSSVGTNGTITLSQSAENFNYIEIFYTDNNGRQPHSIKIHSPNGKYVSLSCIEPSTTNSDPRMYIRASGWTISGTSMTVGRSDLSGANRGIYGMIYPHASGTYIDVNVTEDNCIKIFRVLGYQ